MCFAEVGLEKIALGLKVMSESAAEVEMGLVQIDEDLLAEAESWPCYMSDLSKLYFLEEQMMVEVMEEVFRT